MKRKLSLIAALAALGVLSAVGVALASATFYTDGSGPDVNKKPAPYGFVGKGDVQTALGLKNNQMQAAYTGVTFKFVSSATYEFDCEWYTGPAHNLRRHENTKTAETGVNAALVDDPKKTGQFTGWRLTDLVGGVINQPAEPTDADCGAEGNEMKTIVPGSVELVEGSQTGGLVAVYNGTDYPLTTTILP